ncbi:MAG: prephenate dehydrogenase, partial [Bacilli bacterium]
VFIVGLGLIGGSIALACKKDPNVEVIGYDVSQNNCALARQLAVVDSIADSYEQGAVQGDVIIFATPVQQTEVLLGRLTELPLQQGVIVTDVGSTKGTLVEQSAHLSQHGILFIGGHPMAGSHKSGVSASRAHLFENAFYVLTPTCEEGFARVEELQHLLRFSGAKFVLLTPERHDEIVGAISHFPHIVAAALVHEVEVLNNIDPLAKQLAAGGFRDITRIASSNPTMWRDILLHNRDSLLSLFQSWQQQMKKIEQFVQSGDEEQIYQFFDQAKQFRDQLPERGKGAIENFYELYIDVPDYAGAIADVTRILADEQISILNLRILEVRENILGVLVIRFRTDEDRLAAQKALQIQEFASVLQNE